MSEKIQISGAEVLAFIAENQTNPELLEHLAADVMQQEREYAAKINQAVASTTSLESDSIMIDTFEHPGYRLDVLYYKEADPKDATAWMTSTWFLNLNEQGQIYQILKLAPVEPQPIEDAAPVTAQAFAEEDPPLGVPASIRNGPHDF